MNDKIIDLTLQAVKQVLGPKFNDNVRNQARIIAQTMVSELPIDERAENAVLSSKTFVPHPSMPFTQLNETGKAVEEYLSKNKPKNVPKEDVDSSTSNDTQRWPNGPTQSG